MFRVLVIGRPFANFQGRGIERYTFNLINGLVEAGDRVDFVGEGPIAARVSKAIPPYASPASPVLYDLLATAGHLLRTKLKFDIAHFSNVSSGAAVPILRSRARHVVVTCHDLYGLVTEGMHEESESVRGRFHLDLFERSARASFSRADRIIADSAQTAAEIAEFEKELRGKVTVVNPGVSQMFRPLVDSRTRSNRDHLSLGYVGTLTASRRIDRALRVVKLLQRRGVRSKLTIVGTGPLENVLRCMAQDLGIVGEVEFRGFVRDEDLVGAYNEFDLLLHPVLYEGFGYTIIEAEACGVPVVVFKDARISPEVTSASQRPADEDEAASIIEGVRRTREYHQLLRERALSHASAFARQKMIRGIRSVYEDLIEHE